MRRHLTALLAIVALAGCSAEPQQDPAEARESYELVMSARGIDAGTAGQLAEAVCRVDSERAAQLLRDEIRGAGGKGAEAFADVVELGVPAYCPEHAELWRGVAG